MNSAIFQASLAATNAASMKALAAATAIGPCIPHAHHLFALLVARTANTAPQMADSIPSSSGSIQITSPAMNNVTPQFLDDIQKQLEALESQPSSDEDERCKRRLRTRRRRRRLARMMEKEEHHPRTVLMDSTSRNGFHIFLRTRIYSIRKQIR